MIPQTITQAKLIKHFFIEKKKRKEILSNKWVVFKLNSFTIIHTLIINLSLSPPSALPLSSLLDF
jgi:hypothetical protein